jgi:four helix bundle protein
MQNYKDLKVWEEGHMLTLKIYKVTMNFPDNEKYGLTNQIRRSAFSVPSNIAEGCGKFKQADIANYFQIALGSANETDYLLLLSKDLNYLSEDNFRELEESINKIKAMLISLIKKVRAKVIGS